MKSLIVLMVFAIGMLIALPATSSGSMSPPDQVSYVIEQPAIAPAIVFVQANTLVVVYNQINQATEFIEVQEKGGRSIGQCQITAPMIYYSNKDVMMPAPPLKKIDLIEFRLCQYNYGIRNLNNELLQGYKISLLPVTIRKLMQV